MKILVSGGYGFIGSNFIRYLLSKYPEIKVLNIDKLTYASNLDNLKDIENNKNFKFIKCDICNFENLAKIVKRYNPDCIVNFAAETHVDRSISSPKSFVNTDVIGTFNFLEISRKLKVSKFIQISTDEVYGSTKNHSFKEFDKLNPTSPYSASKASADLLCQAYFRTYNLPVVIIRPTNNYGPFQHPEKFIPLMITNAISDEYLPIYGNGKNIRDWLFVLDTVKAIDLIIKKGKIGDIYNISSKNELENLFVVKKILKILKKPNALIKFVSDRPAHDFRYSVNPEKIYKLGFKPDYDFDKGIEYTVKWYSENKKWWMKIKNSKEFSKYYKEHYKI